MFHYDLKWILTKFSFVFVSLCSPVWCPVKIQSSWSLPWSLRRPPYTAASSASIRWSTWAPRILKMASAPLKTQEREWPKVSPVRFHITGQFLGQIPSWFLSYTNFHFRSKASLITNQGQHCTVEEINKEIKPITGLTVFSLQSDDIQWVVVTV